MYFLIHPQGWINDERMAIHCRIHVFNKKTINYVAKQKIATNNNQICTIHNQIINNGEAAIDDSNNKICTDRSQP